MKKGFTLIEILLSLTIFAGILVVLMNMMGVMSRSFSEMGKSQESSLLEIGELRFFISSALNAMNKVELNGSNELRGIYYLPNGTTSADLSVSDEKNLTFTIGSEEIGALSLKNISVISMSMADASMLEVQIESPQRIYTLLFGGDFR